MLRALVLVAVLASPAAFAQARAQDPHAGDDHVNDPHHHAHDPHAPLPPLPKNLPGGLKLELEEAIREGLPTPRDAAMDAARHFFLTLLNGDARAIADGSELPFALEDRKVADRDELFGEWLRHLRSKRLDLHVLYGVELFTPEELEKKYGKPPARLQNLPWKAKGTWIAVGNLSGRPALAIFREISPGELRLTGYHD